MSVTNAGVGADGLLAAKETLSRPVEEFGNDSRVEALWAMKAMEHAEVYFNILCSVDPKQIPRLSSNDDEIYEKFKKDFSDFKADKFEEKDLKSEDAKKKWRAFCESLKHVEDYSFATLVRMDSSLDYSEENSIIATKVQFYAIELVRNREGHNNQIRQKYKPTPRKHRVQQKQLEGAQAPNMSEIEYELKQIITGNHKLLQEQ